MSIAGPLAEAADVLYREAECLDERDWDGWLSLYTPDCVFWVPSWISDDAICSDPQREISLIYYASRSGLADRVWRVRSGESVASLPLPRTVHALGNLRLGGTGAESPGSMSVKSNWSVDLFSTKTQASHRFFGRYEHRLSRVADRWMIASKKVILLNDYLPSSLDFYSV